MLTYVHKIIQISPSANASYGANNRPTYGISLYDYDTVSIATLETPV